MKLSPVILTMLVVVTVSRFRAIDGNVVRFTFGMKNVTLDEFILNGETHLIANDGDMVVDTDHEFSSADTLVIKQFIVDNLATPTAFKRFKLVNPSKVTSSGVVTNSDTEIDATL